MDSQQKHEETWRRAAEKSKDLDFLIGKFGEKGVAEAFIKAQQVRGQGDSWSPAKVL